MERVDIQQVLDQMRAIKTQARMQPLETAPQAAEGMDFMGMLKRQVDNVNELQQTSKAMTEAFELGTRDLSLSEVMVASNKASLAFRMTLEVRNKVVEAYKEIMRMPV